MGLKTLIRKTKSKIKEIIDYNFGIYQYWDINFDYTKPLHPEAYEVFKQGCNILNSIGVPYCLNFGTLLGAYRDHKLIPHDSDLDITVLHPADVKKIEKAFINEGFHLASKIVTLGQVQTLVFTTKNETIFDISFFEEIDGYRYCFHDEDGYWKIPSKFLENFIPYEMSGDIFYIPQKAEELLAYTYGENWKTPKNNKSKEWRDDYYGSFIYLKDTTMPKEIKRLRKQRVKK